MSIQDQSAKPADLAAAMQDVVAGAQKNGSTLRVRVEAERLWTATLKHEMSREELEARLSRAALRRGIPLEL